VAAALPLIESVEVRIYVPVLVARWIKMFLQVVVYWPGRVIIMKTRVQPRSLIEVSMDSGREGTITPQGRLSL